MRIFSRSAITEYGKSNAQAREELAIWYAKAEAADWIDFNQLKADMPATDYVGNDRFVFNIKGNHYRLIAMLFFTTKRLYIRGIFTHAEYSKLSKNQKKLLNL
ncbi:hypothetical protein A0257_04190 [Hymenobacter psoromatis]|nr:hypothetical protein A0257_04190 [Hymenobacter psoromatis]